MLKGKKNQVFILTLTYLILIFVFLHSQFHSSQQSEAISNLRLTNSEQELNISSMKFQAPNAKKVIFLLIDSSKFTYFHEIPIIPKLLDSEPEKCVIKKTIVAQPTMTTQKIQALMTGSEIFSTTSIIDAFFSSSVQIDNIVSQVNHNKGKTIFLGDDTWGKLFDFQISYPCVNTFDIWDWETCDSIIYKNLLDEINDKGNEKNLYERELLIAHFLALDHIGHSTSSITHEKFGEKKLQISKFIQEIVEKMEQNYVVIITGDHGMRDDGNHGGGSSDETESFVFIYSKGEDIIEFDIEQENKQKQNIRQVLQPDITATLSLLLEVPIPENSIGIPILMRKSKGRSDQVKKSLDNHFSELIRFNRIECKQSSLKKIQKNCLSHLSHKEPNTNLLYFLILIMLGICLRVAYLLNISIWQFLLGAIISVPHSFSWLVIRYSSTYYLLSCLAICTVMVAQNFKSIKLIIPILILSQIEKTKIGEYTTNAIRVDIFQLILSRQAFTISLALGWCIYNVIKILKPKNRSRKDQIGQSSKKSPQLAIKYLQCSVIGAIAASYICKQAELNELSHFFNVLLTLMELSAFLYIYYQNNEEPKPQNKSTQLNFAQYYLIIFLGDNSILLYLIVKMEARLLSEIGDRIYKPYMCYALAHFMWWVLGNRYEYSSIDIRQSYVFSASYHYILNPLCLFIYMLVPYLIVFLLCLCDKKENNFITTRFTPVAAEDNNGSQLAIHPAFSVASEKSAGIMKIPKFLIIPQAWLIFCFLNLTYNNEKILYTVVYVPMTLIQTAKLIILSSCILIYMIFAEGHD